MMIDITSWLNDCCVSEGGHIVNPIDIKIARQAKTDQERARLLPEIEKGLIVNAEDGIAHSIHNLQLYRQSSADSHLKWAILSIVQAGELLSNVLLIRAKAPLEILFTRKAAGKELDFHPPSFNQGLLVPLEKYRENCLPPITVEELALLKTAEDLAQIRNDLMHRTFVTLDDKEKYARAALSILLVFEYRFRRIDFQTTDEGLRLDSEAASLLRWMVPNSGPKSKKKWREGEMPSYLKSASAYLKSVGEKEADAPCPRCSLAYVSDRFCRVCRCELCSVECESCGLVWYEENEWFDQDTCPDCGAAKDKLSCRARW